MCDTPIVSVSGLSPKFHSYDYMQGGRRFLPQQHIKGGKQMVDMEMLSAISELLEEKLDQKLENKFDGLRTEISGLKLKVDGLDSEVSGLKQEVGDIKQEVGGIKQEVSGIKQEVSGIKQEVGGIKQEVNSLKQEVNGLKSETGSLKEELRYIRIVQLENNVMPRLATIESCYLDTSRKYIERTEQIDGMASDIEVLKCVVEKHSQKLEKIPV